MGAWPVCMYVCLCTASVQCLWRSGDGDRYLGTGVAAAAWVLGIEPRTSGRTVSALKCRAIFSRPSLIFNPTQRFFSQRLEIAVVRKSSVGHCNFIKQPINIPIHCLRISVHILSTVYDSRQDRLECSLGLSDVSL